ncbi:MAG: hypothetical protein ABW034_25000 [Steroidobacteraceae bacterium]
MNERVDNRFEHEDPDVRQAYRALPDLEIPAALDERVLEAARTAIAKRRNPAWKRWSAPLALAASLTVVIAIVLDPGARKNASALHSPPTAPARVAHKVEAPKQQPPSVGSRAAAPAELLKEEKRAAPAKEPSQEMTVTAQRRQEALQDVPVSILVMPEPETYYERPPAMVAPSLSLPAPAATDERTDAVHSAAQAETSPAAPEAATQSGASERAAVTASRSSSLSEVARRAKAEAPAGAAAKERDAQGEVSSVEEVAVAGSVQDPKITRWLQKIHTLQSEGKPKRAAREIEKLKRAYPDVNVEDALEALRQSNPGQ